MRKLVKNKETFMIYKLNRADYKACMDIILRKMHTKILKFGHK